MCSRDVGTSMGLFSLFHEHHRFLSFGTFSVCDDDDDENDDISLRQAKLGCPTIDCFSPFRHLSC